MILFFVRDKVDSDVYVKYCVRTYLAHLGRPTPDFDVIRADGKKPRLSAEGLYFSLSHTDGVTLVAVSDSEVGVDVEKIRPVDVSKFSSFIDAEDELDFFYEWTRREAYAKYTGEGMAILRSPLPDGVPPIDTFPIYDGQYVVSVCAEAQNIQAFDMSPDYIE